MAVHDAGSTVGPNYLLSLGMGIGTGLMLGRTIWWSCKVYSRMLLLEVVICLHGIKNQEDTIVLTHEIL